MCVDALQMTAFDCTHLLSCAVALELDRQGLVEKLRAAEAAVDDREREIKRLKEEAEQLSSAFAAANKGLTLLKASLTETQYDSTLTFRVGFA